MFSNRVPPGLTPSTSATSLLSWVSILCFPPSPTQLHWQGLSGFDICLIRSQLFVSGWFTYFGSKCLGVTNRLHITNIENNNETKCVVRRDHLIPLVKQPLERTHGCRGSNILVCTCVLYCFSCRFWTFSMQNMITRTIFRAHLLLENNVFFFISQ